MNCQHCDTPLHPGQAFCAGCGRSVLDTDIERPSGTFWDSIITKVVGASAGKYRLERVLGQGGMAAVYLAHDLRLNRPVAIKIMAPSMMATPDAAERFRQEAITVAQLKHQHIVTVYAVEEFDDVRFIVMEFVEGAPLQDVIKAHGRLDVDVVRVWLAQTADALDCAHRREIVHRDVKPANILIHREGNAVLTDFGIAKAAESPSLTQTGMTVGTPTYMSPEQCASSAVTSASDQYSLGIVAYEMLAGAPPFSGPTLTVLQAHLTEQPDHIASLRPDCPTDLANVIERMLAKEAADRWPSLAHVVEAVAAPPHGRTSPLRERMIGLLPTAAPSTSDAAISHPEAATVKFDTGAETVKFDTAEVDERTVKMDSAQADAVRPPSSASAAPPQTDKVPTTRVTVPPTDGGRSIRRLGFAGAGVAAIAVAGWWAWQSGGTTREDAALTDTAAMVSSRPTSGAEREGRAPTEQEDRSGTGEAAPPINPSPGGDGRLLLSMPRTSLTVGDSVLARVLLGERPSPQTVEWDITDGDAAATIRDGWILGVGPGTAEITARSGGQRLSTSVTVDAVAPRLVQITAGTHHTCGTTRDGEAYCWGRNQRTQVDRRARGIQTVPLPVSGTFSQVASGGVMTCALDRSTRARCWGEDMAVPDGTFQSIVAGVDHACALAPGGAVVCWGSNQYGQLGTGAGGVEELGFAQVASGDHHTCGLTADGRAYCWGDNRMGQTGVGGPTTGRLASTSIATATEVTGGHTDLIAIAAGAGHTCALTRGGAALCWGANDRGQLGDGTRTDRSAPRPITRARGGGRVVFDKLAAGGAHTCAVAANARLFCWGANDAGQIGDGTTEDRVAPVRIDLGADVVDITVGDRHSCAVTANGETLCWGSNEFGQLGDGSTTRPTRPVVPGRVGP